MIVCSYSKEREELFANYERLASPAHLIALSCGSEEQERRLTSLLLQHNIDYTRSSTDIEIIYTNAKEQYSRREKQA